MPYSENFDLEEIFDLPSSTYLHKLNTGQLELTLEKPTFVRIEVLVSGRKEKEILPVELTCFVDLSKEEMEQGGEHSKKRDSDDEDNYDRRPLRSPSTDSSSSENNASSDESVSSGAGDKKEESSLQNAKRIRPDESITASNNRNISSQEAPRNLRRQIQDNGVNGRGRAIKRRCPDFAWNRTTENSKEAQRRVVPISHPTSDIAHQNRPRNIHNQGQNRQVSSFVSNVSEYRQSDHTNHHNVCRRCSGRILLTQRNEDEAACLQRLISGVCYHCERRYRVMAPERCSICMHGICSRLACMLFIPCPAQQHPRANVENRCRDCGRPIDPDMPPEKCVRCSWNLCSDPDCIRRHIHGQRYEEEVQHRRDRTF